MLIVIVKIKTCMDCRHIGAERTPKGIGAKPCCNHDMGTLYAGNDGKNSLDLKNMVEFAWIPYGVKARNDSLGIIKDRYTVRVPKGVPRWCPLKHGEVY